MKPLLEKDVIINRNVCIGKNVKIGNNIKIKILVTLKIQKSDNVDIGPFARTRDANIEKGVKVRNFVEKNLY